MPFLKRLFAILHEKSTEPSPAQECTSNQSLFIVSIPGNTSVNFMVSRIGPEWSNRTIRRFRGPPM